MKQLVVHVSVDRKARKIFYNEGKGKLQDEGKKDGLAVLGDQPMQHHHSNQHLDGHYVQHSTADKVSERKNSVLLETR